MICHEELAIQYLRAKVKHVDFELYDIVKNEIPNLGIYNVVGFATFTDFGGVPQYFHTFFDHLDHQDEKYGFIFNTDGFYSGGTLKSFADLAASRGFIVISGYSLHTPESYPPRRARNRTFDNAPNPNEYERFKGFNFDTISIKHMMDEKNIKLSRLLEKLDSFSRPYINVDPTELSGMEYYRTVTNFKLDTYETGDDPAVTNNDLPARLNHYKKRESAMPNISVETFEVPNLCKPYEIISL